MNTIRRNIGRQVSEILKKHPSCKNEIDDIVPRIMWTIRLTELKPQKERPQFSNIELSLGHLKACKVVPQLLHKELISWASKIVEDSNQSELDKRIKVTECAFEVNIPPEEFLKSVLTDIISAKKLSDLPSDLMKYRYRSNNIVEEKAHQNIVIDYSSPNIAKPFHAGHLRSTVIGNVIGNICEYLGHNVTRINYLGDWGTQFGYICVGLKKYFIEEEFKKSPIHHYYDVYVRANADARKDPSLHLSAMTAFSNMEKGYQEELDIWRKCRETSIDEYKKIYKRLGIQFDVYHGESMYQKKSLELVEEFKKNEIMHFDSSSGMTYAAVTRDNGKEEKISLVKSNGSSLYVLRDAAAAIHRKELYNFDRLLYVVENKQNLNFEHLMLLLAKLGHKFAQEQPINDIHIKFGSIKGMSSRFGDVVFLKDILDAAKLKMKRNMVEKLTTKIEKEGDILDETAEHLGVSAIIVQDLQFPRTIDYEFDLEKMLRVKGKTGVFLQYTHARLCSIFRDFWPDQEDLSENPLTLLLEKCDMSHLEEKEAFVLIHYLAKYDEAVYNAYIKMEPSLLVHYLFWLCRYTSRTLQVLYIKDQPEEKANPRLLMYYCVRSILADGLKLLGITPMDRF